MPVTATITAVNATGRQDRNQNHIYYLNVNTPNGPVENAYFAAKTFEPKVGESFEANIENTDKGPRIRRDFSENGQQSSNSSFQSREEGQIVGWAHTLAAFELAHNLTHADVANRAQQILSARAGDSSHQTPANNADSTGGQGADASGPPLVASSDDDIQF